MWGADATQLQMDSGQPAKAFFLSPTSPPPHFFFLKERE